MASCGRPSSSSDGKVSKVTARAAVAGGLVRAVQKGDKVQAWSSSGKRWLDGSVEEILEQQFTVANGHDVPKGSVKILSASGHRLVPPDRSELVLRLAASVTVVAPGAGTGINNEIYKDLGEDARFNVKIIGKKGAPYDRYPECWEHGAPPPNLESFSADVVTNQGLGDVLVLGSRGGQVVLPCLWKAKGSQVPPAVVINGGCAMKMPGPAVCWPADAVTLLLLGGQDFFKGKLSSAEYLSSTVSQVPAASSRTAILYVREMQHMPQKTLLRTVLQQLLLAAISWKACGSTPEAQLKSIVATLEGEGCWSGTLLFTSAAGVWKKMTFGCGVMAESKNRPVASNVSGGNAAVVPEPIEELAQSAAEEARGHREAAGQARRLATAEDVQPLGARVLRSR